MRRGVWLAVAVAVAATATAGEAAAQNPSVSPYLNLLRRNTPTYLNYYGLVQPQVQAQNALARQQQQIGGLNQQVNTMLTQPDNQSAGGLTTGKVAGYFTHRAYFMTMGGGGGGGGGMMGGAGMANRNQMNRGGGMGMGGMRR